MLHHEDRDPRRDLHQANSHEERNDLNTIVKDVKVKYEKMVQEMAQKIKGKQSVMEDLVDHAHKNLEHTLPT